jgi:hypothetical protein
MGKEARDRVWSMSRYGGSHLVLLLALAERADADGFCWPGKDELQQRCRCKERNLQKLLREVEEGGELFSECAGGRHKTPRYFLTVGLDSAAIERVLAERFEMSQTEATAMAGTIGERQYQARHGVESDAERVQDNAPFSRQQSRQKRVQSNAPIEDKRVQDNAPFSDEKGAQSCAKRVHDCAQKGARLCAPPTPPNKENRQEPSDEPSERENARAARRPLMPPSSPPRVSWEKADTEYQPRAAPEGILCETICELCHLDPQNPGTNNAKFLPTLQKWLREQMPGVADEEIAAEVKRRFANWHIGDFPWPSQIQSHWKRRESNERNELSNGTNREHQGRTAGTYETGAERRSRRKQNYYSDLDARRAELEERKRAAGLG